MPTLAAVTAVNDGADLKGKTALVVGGTSGCGKGVALVLARRGCAVTVVGRNEARGAATVEALEAVAPKAVRPHQGVGSIATMKFVALDVRSLAGIAKVCDEFAASTDALDFLSLSCTRGGIQGYRPTAEELDERVCTMYLSRLAFVHRLTPLLLKASNPRVISILSAGHHSAYGPWESDFLTRRANMTSRTFACGFYTDNALAKLAREHPSLSVTHMYPGIVNSNWALELPFGLKQITNLMFSTSGRSVAEAGEFLAYPLLAPGAFASGFHSLTPNAEPCAHTAGDAKTEDGVWAKTLEVYEQKMGRA